MDLLAFVFQTKAGKVEVLPEAQVALADRGYLMLLFVQVTRENLWMKMSDDQTCATIGSKVTYTSECQLVTAVRVPHASAELPRK